MAVNRAAQADKKRVDQSGGVMLEVVLMLGLMTITAPLMIDQMNKRSAEINEINVANHMRELKAAVEGYLKMHAGAIKVCHDESTVTQFAPNRNNACFDSVKGAWYPFAPDYVGDLHFPLTFPDLIDAGFLSSGWLNRNSADQSYLISVRKSLMTDPALCLLTDRDLDGIADGDRCSDDTEFDPEDLNQAFNGCGMRFEALILAQPLEPDTDRNGIIDYEFDALTDTGANGLDPLSLHRVAKAIGPDGGMYLSDLMTGQPSLVGAGSLWAADVGAFFDPAQGTRPHRPYLDSSGGEYGYNAVIAAHVAAGQPVIRSPENDPHAGCEPELPVPF